MSDSEINEDDDILEQENDVEIMDENAESDAIEGEEEQKETQFEEQPQIAIERNTGDPTAATYIFSNEDHTLGNALRFMLVKRPEVEFCGYSIPHPSENFMNLRLQTIDKNSNDVLKGGLKDLAQLCDIIENKFDEAVTKYQKKSTKQK